MKRESTETKAPREWDYTERKYPQSKENLAQKAVSFEYKDGPTKVPKFKPWPEEKPKSFVKGMMSKMKSWWDST